MSLKGPSYGRNLADIAVQMAMKRTRGSSYGPSKRRRMSRGRKSRRRIIRRYRNKRRGGIVSRVTRQPFADRVFTTLYYRDLKIVSVSAGATPIDGVPYQSSIYDPQASSGGHKPLWCNTLEAIYNKYRIHGIKYRFKCCNTNTNQLGWMYVLQSNTQYTFPTNTNTNTLAERRLCQRKSVTTTTNPAVIKGYMPIGRPWGLSKQEMKADEDFEASVGVNPIKMAFLNLMFESMNTSAIFNVEVELKYLVEFHTRKEITGS